MTLDRVSSDSENGQMFEIHLTGMIVYGALIIVANLKIILFSKKQVVVTIVILIISILFYPLMYWLWNLRSTSGVYGFFSRTFSPTFWLALIATIAISILGDWAV